MKIFIIAGTLLVFLIPNMAFPDVYEQYYYFEGHKLTFVPEFCIIEFEDPQLPNAPKIMYEKTENAVNEWKEKLIQRTGSKAGWDFSFVKISQTEFDNLFSKHSCDIAVFFQREPITEEEKQLAGHTFAGFGVADITIFYLEPVFSPSGETFEFEGETYEWMEITGYKNNIDPMVSDTIKHEIGHALGLDHYPAEPEEFVEVSPGTFMSPSIMVENLDYVEGETWIYPITDYDISALVNYYGNDGISESWIWEILDYVLIGLVVALIIWIIERRKKKRSTRSNPLM